jgi:hypothetical protein
MLLSCSLLAVVARKISPLGLRCAGPRPLASLPCYNGALVCYSPPRRLIRPSSTDSRPFPPSTPCTPAAGIAFIEWVAQPLCLVLLSIPASARKRTETRTSHTLLTSPHFFFLLCLIFSSIVQLLQPRSQYPLTADHPPVRRGSTLGLSVASPFAALAAASDTHHWHNLSAGF